MPVGLRAMIRVPGAAAPAPRSRSGVSGNYDGGITSYTNGHDMRVGEAIAPGAWL